MTAGAVLLMCPVPAHAHGGGGGAHGGMAAGMGAGASGGLGGTRAGGIETSAQGAAVGRGDESAGAGIHQAGDINADAGSAAVHSGEAGSRDTETGSRNLDVGSHDTDTANAHSAHMDSDMDRPAAGRSASADALQLAATMHSINQTTFDARTQLVHSVDMRLKSSRHELHELQANARDLRADAREKFRTDLRQLKARNAELKAAIKGTKDADDSAWTTRREALATAYQHYAEAMADLEADARDGR